MHKNIYFRLNAFNLNANSGTFFFFSAQSDAEIGWKLFLKVCNVKMTRNQLAYSMKELF